MPEHAKHRADIAVALHSTRWESKERDIGALMVNERASSLSSKGFVVKARMQCDMCVDAHLDLARDNPMINHTAQQLGNYRLIRQLGSGGFADVYLGEHLYLKTLAAIKVLRASLSAQEKQQFLHEAQIIAQLKHMHIVRVLDFGTEGTTPFLVTDYAPKGTLRQAHPRGRVLPLPLVVTYVKQIAAALQYAHDAKLIHRDVKPENMLLGSQGEVLLSDFGIAVAAHHTSSLKTLDPAGTPPYMAPELIQGKPRPASDQYALGIVVYEWLCGERPFQGDQVLHQQLAVPPPALHEKNSTISPAVEQVVLRALAKDPQQRFASIEAFAMALERAAQQHHGGTELQTYDGHDSNVLALAWSPNGTSIVSTDLNGQVHLWAPRQGASPSMKRLLHVNAGVVWTVAWSPDGRSIAAGSSSHSVTIWDVATGICKRHLSISGELDAVAWSPDSTRIASGSLERPWEKGQSYHIHTWDAQTGAKLFTTHLRVRLENGTELLGLLWPGVVSIRWCPDSRRIALARCDNIVEIWDTTTQQMLVNQSNRAHTDDAGSVVWSPDGRRIAAIMDDRSIEIWDGATGSVLCSYRGQTSSVACIAWSPDSERIASLSSDGAIQVWDAATGRHHFTYCDPSQSFSALAWSPDGKRVASANRDWSIRVWQAA